MSILFTDIFKEIMDLVFPRVCPACEEKLRSNEEFICIKCNNQIKKIEGEICKRCGKNFDEDKFCLACKNNNYQFDTARAVSYFESVIAVLVKKFKYNSRTELADFFANMISEYILSNNLYKGIEHIVPVPLHNSRLRDRGYNQSLLIAEKVANKCNLKLLKNNLIKIKNTKSQTALSFKERLANVKDAYWIYNPHELENLNVILIDDVFTTGATTSECARTLKHSRCQQVHVITLCHATLDATTK